MGDGVGVGVGVGGGTGVGVGVGGGTGVGDGVGTGVGVGGGTGVGDGVGTGVGDGVGTGVGVGGGTGVGVGVGTGVGVGVGVGLPLIVRVRAGEVATPVPWQSAPLWALTVNVELPGSTASVVVTDKDVETSAFVMVSGFAPKTAVAPDGRPLALSVRVQALLLPFWTIDRFP